MIAKGFETIGGVTGLIGFLIGALALLAAVIALTSRLVELRRSKIDRDAARMKLESETRAVQTKLGINIEVIDYSKLLTDLGVQSSALFAEQVRRHASRRSTLLEEIYKEFINHKTLRQYEYSHLAIPLRAGYVLVASRDAEAIILERLHHASNPVLVEEKWRDICNEYYQCQKAKSALLSGGTNVMRDKEITAVYNKVSSLEKKIGTFLIDNRATIGVSTLVRVEKLHQVMRGHLELVLRALGSEQAVRPVGFNNVALNIDQAISNAHKFILDMLGDGDQGADPIVVLPDRSS